jgi:hypothetical protein
VRDGNGTVGGSFQEPVLKGCGGDAKLLREPARHVLHHARVGDRVVEVNDVRLGHEPVKLGVVPHALLFENGLQLPVEAVVALLAEAGKEVKDRALAGDVGGVVEVPAHADEHHRAREEDGQRSHLRDEEEGNGDARHLHPRVERRPVAWRIGRDFALPHHDDREVEERKDEELECTGQLRHALFGEHEDNDEHQPHRHHDRAGGRVEATNPGEAVGQ